MRDDYFVTWVDAAVSSLEKAVAEEHPEDGHRWPIIRFFDAEGYVWKDTHLALVVRDKLSGIPFMGERQPIGAAAPKVPPTRESISEWHLYVGAAYGVRRQDMVVIIPIKGEGPAVGDDWKVWSKDEKNLWWGQIRLAIRQHRSYLRELDARRGALNLAQPPEISASLEAFRGDHPNPERTGFLMMRLTDSPAHKLITKAVRSTAADHGLEIVRADDKEYHPDLYPNVLTYIYGSGFGVSVFERIEQEEFNPNVSLEVGCMLGLGKPICFLKDKNLRALHTDLIGKLYRAFDPQDPAATIPQALSGWLRDKGLI
jgi:hypothetical protein